MYFKTYFYMATEVACTISQAKNALPNYVFILIGIKKQ